MFQKTTVSNVEFFPLEGTSQFIGFATSPHNLVNYDRVSLSGVSTDVNIDGRFFLVGVSTEKLILALDVQNASTTGIVTYFNVTGDLTFSKN